jgi:hypothetical protein
MSGLMGEKPEELGSAAFYLGKGARIDSVKIEGNVAGRDVNITQAAAQVDDRASLLAVIEQLQGEIAALQEAPGGLRTDAEDELKKAQAAASEGDDGRLIEKLTAAQGYVERIAASLPAAVSIAQTVATLIQKVPGLSG